MKRREHLRRHLHTIEQLLRGGRLWQELAPPSLSFESTQPFCMDTLQPHEWLQWVLLPRMRALLDGNHPLPEAFAIAPYYEMTLDVSPGIREPLLAELYELDAIFAADKI